MLRYLTHKLRTQSLNESEPYKTDDDRDSGTESDDEGADIEELQKYMESLIQLESKPRVRKPHHHHHHHHPHEVEVTSRGTTPCRHHRPAPPTTPLVDSALPSDSDHNLDIHSSEEELEVINATVQKRKWRGDDGSCDGIPAVDGDRKPLRFRASPPAHARRPGGGCARQIPSHELCAAASPRKRHRRAATSPRQQRPCLDFEKMQQINRVRLL